MFSAGNRAREVMLIAFGEGMVTERREIRGLEFNDSIKTPGIAFPIVFATVFNKDKN